MKEWSFDAVIENIPAVTELVNAELKALGCPIRAQIELDVVIDELFSNIAFYAYAPGKGRVTLRLEPESDPPGVSLTFIDSGMPFDPLSAADPDVTLAAEERRLGGLGVLLVKKTMDEAHYEYRDGQNVLRIRKHFRKRQGLKA